MERKRTARIIERMRTGGCTIIDTVLKRTYAFRQISILLSSALGRRRLWMGLRHRMGALTRPMASIYRRTFIRRTHVVAVVGSFGKTTTTRAVAAAIGQAQKHLSWGMNAGGFLAEALLRVGPGTSAVAVEVGIRARGRMVRHARLLRPDLAVVTSIGTEHHGSLGSIERIRWEKAEMLRSLPRRGTAIVNGDDPNARWMAGQTRAAVVTFGFAHGNDIRATDYRSHGLLGGRFALHMDRTSRTMRTKLVGRHQVYALLAAAGVAKAEGRDLEESLCALEHLEPTPHRLWPMPLPGGAGLLLDDYKSVLETVETALATLAEIRANRKTVVLGTIYEPPGEESEAYHHVGQRIAQIADDAIFIGADSAYRDLQAGACDMSVGPVAVRNVFEAASAVRERLTPGSVVLVKGLDSQRLERVALLLTGVRVQCGRGTCNASLTWDCALCPWLEQPKRAIDGPSGSVIRPYRN